jgi:hypothetical protein
MATLVLSQVPATVTGTSLEVSSNGNTMLRITASDADGKIASDFATFAPTLIQYGPFKGQSMAASEIARLCRITGKDAASLKAELKASKALPSMHDLPCSIVTQAASAFDEPEIKLVFDGDHYVKAASDADVDAIFA